MSHISERLQKAIAASPDKPLPTCSARMAMFDALPREVRQTIANLDRCPSIILKTAIAMHTMGKSTKAIIKKLNDQNLALLAQSPAARTVAQAELLELGL